ncbi:four helix bundle protein [bacterium]|nr:four helix bundle protein [bacterium]
MKDKTQNSKVKTQSHSSKRKTDLRYRCYCFSINVIKFLERLPKERNSRIIADQLLRAATSIGANVIEAKSASSKRDFVKFYEIALKSANETKYWLGLLRDGVEIERTKINPLLKEVQELSSIIASSLLTMKGKK